MRRVLAPSVGAVLALGLLASPAGVAAAAPPIAITADAPAAVPAGHLWTFNDFFPRSLSVHRGQTIELDLAGFHTATLLPAGMTASQGERAMGFVQADPDDTTRNPNGTSHTIVNIRAAFPVPGGCGSPASPCSFGGSAPVSTGAPLAGPPAPLNVRMDAPVGAYRIICLVHPGMRAWVRVVPDDQAATTPVQAAHRAARQVAADLAEGWAAYAAANRHRSVVRDGVRTWIMSAGTGTADGRVAIDEMLPAVQHVGPHDRVRWITRSPNEVHTVTFPTDLHTDILPMCESGDADVPATPTVIPPSGPFDFTCGGPPVELENDGGNGVRHITSPTTVADSGLIASDRSSDGYGVPDSAFRASWTASFRGAVAGTYTYVCQIHDGMRGTIVVP